MGGVARVWLVFRMLTFTQQDTLLIIMMDCVQRNQNIKIGDLIPDAMKYLFLKH